VNTSRCRVTSVDAVVHDTDTATYVVTLQRSAADAQGPTDSPDSRALPTDARVVLYEWLTAAGGESAAAVLAG
jgi:hypothetical protein